MRQRPFGRTGRSVSELGVGMWGMGGGIGGWTGADDRRSMAVLEAAVDAGITFFDSAQVYGYGHTDGLLGDLVRARPGAGLFTASKVPPKDRSGRRARGAGCATCSRRTTFAGRSTGSCASSGRRPSTSSSSTSGTTPGRTIRAPAGRRGAARRRPGPPRGHQRQPARARERAADAPHGPHRRRPGGLQRVRPGAGGRAVPAVPRARDRGHRAGAAGRGEPHRDADRRHPLAGRRLAERLLLAGEPAEHRRARRGAPPARAGRGVDGRHGAALHPLEPGRDDGDPRHPDAEHLAANVAAAAAGPLPAELVAALRDHRWDRPPSRSSQS